MLGRGIAPSQHMSKPMSCTIAANYTRAGVCNLRSDGVGWTAAERTIMNSIRVIQYGLGPIGCATAQAILEKKGLELVGAVDIAPDKAGKDLASVLGRKRNL